MSANSDSWGLLLCSLGSLTFTAEGNTCTLWGGAFSTFLDHWLTFCFSKYQMSHLLISRSWFTSQYSFLFSVKATAENVFFVFVFVLWEIGGNVETFWCWSQTASVPTTSRLGWTIQGEFMQMLPGQCQPPRPGPTRSLPDVPGACAVPDLPSCR